jgi:drug/metabolite transporter (DMT)-like permease
MPIITLSYIALALFLGYAVAVALSMAATFGISKVSPGFVSNNNRIRREYKFVQDAVWLVCAMAGGYVAALVNGESHSLLVGSGLAAILIAVLWMNVWEMRQRGLGHQLVMSAGSAAGVTVGFLIHLR